MPATEYVLTLSCPDRVGIVHAVAAYLHQAGCNVLDSQQFGDRIAGRFFMRVHVEMVPGPPVTYESLRSGFAAVAAGFGMEWELHDTAVQPRVLIMVSKAGHCLNDLLYRRAAESLRIDVPLVVGNHPDLAPLAAAHGVPFEHVPAGADAGDPLARQRSEGRLLDLVSELGIDFVVLARYMRILSPELCAKLIIWMFAIQSLMVLSSLGSFYFNKALAGIRYGGKKDFNWEAPLTDLVWITSIVSILVCFGTSKLLLGDFTIPKMVDGVLTDVPLPNLWWVLSAIIGCGTLAGALIMEFTKIFVSTQSRHVQEVTHASDHGGASLNVLSGLVAGNFSAFWMGLVILGLMFISFLFSENPDFVALIPSQFAFGAPIFAFGLVAFGFLAMAPVTIAVDSFGPVTDNAQSVYELSRIEKQPNISEEIERDFGFKPDFATAKLELEKGDGAGNTFKATAKPVLIGTAVVGSTTMIFGIIMLLEHVFGNAVGRLSLVMPQIVFGLLMGGSVIYWFTGATIQAVVAGAYSAVVFIKKNIRLDKEAASIEDSKRVVAICTRYAQKGMINIFIVVFAFALGLPFLNPYFFIGYLIAIAFFGLFQAIFMANAGGAWDNAKKIVEVDLKMKGTPLHAATVVGDTVGDPFKDTSSVAMNPIIKFTTLFGLLAVEIAVELKQKDPHSPLSYVIGAVCFLIALIFAYRSFYHMRIPVAPTDKH